MPVPPKGNSGSWMVSFRFNEADPRFKQIMEAIDGYKEDNPDLTDGDIFIWALLECSGKQPQKVTSLQKLDSRLANIEGALADMPEILVMNISTALAQLNIDPGEYTDLSGESMENAMGRLVPTDIRQKLYGGLTGKRFDDE